MDNNIRTIGYLGGKSNWSPTATGRFVVDHLPWEYKQVYVEPFAGMLGVLLQRKPVITEIINDRDGHIVNWWRQVRDAPDELGHKVEATPSSRRLFNESVLLLDSPEASDIDKAVALFVVLNQSLMHTSTSNAWSASYSNSVYIKKWDKSQIHDLSERLAKVRLEDKDAIDILKATQTRQHCLIYCDPPYDVDSSKMYRHGVCLAKLEEVLVSQTGKVAISGYGNQWDHLGWQRYEHKTYMHSKTDKVFRRVEVLWTNYDVTQTHKSMPLLKL